ncbi:MetQ/NlpA family ABC transporter substrate-binding protein [Facklamia sp. P13069]|uniref:MetQ/NlpA family ABC transporter substrate-binding protein n=1 Tax=Facklamia sp. P13069 TaxID=3421954 RepID=UPI003D16B487
MKKFLKVLLVGSLLGGVTLNNVFAEDKEDFSGQSVSVGVASEYEEDVWQSVADIAEEEEGIKIKLVLFNDYVQPNISLSDGSIDLNAFQHVEFLNDWNQSNDGDLVSIGYTYVAPLKVYSEKIDSLDQLKEGDKIAIPNDATNGGRALLALEQAGVIEVDDEAGVLAEVSDITKNELNLKFEELDAAQLVSALPDVAAAVINNNFANDAELEEDLVIFNDAADIEKLPDSYKNIIASRKEDSKNPLFLKIVELYQSEQTAKKIEEVSKGSDQPAW